MLVLCRRNFDRVETELLLHYSASEVSAELAREPINILDIVASLRRPTEFPLGAQVSGTAPASSKLWMAFRAAREVSFGFASSEQHASSMAFSTYIISFEDTIFNQILAKGSIALQSKSLASSTPCRV